MTRTKYRAINTVGTECIEKEQYIKIKYRVLRDSIEFKKEYRVKGKSMVNYFAC